ncbi:hypothetical protein SK3146_00014 [Paenibacillus konkukensis]|uniref:DUF1254 domain-containing protein n=1 Tax=Paenibacillus konkukensis TaxID=2020716 RepID=A0ABY4REN8_9BACL|nr:DUF1254 domain-containing protein [Paenibacillus konkukensis]UQZ80858.1 hypothetical protein SK3146_00014 [Paenibacillus konkukensis]
MLTNWQRQVAAAHPAPPAHPQDEALSQESLDSMAVDAYIYGFPPVLMDVTRRAGAVSTAEKNRFVHQKEPASPKFTQVVRPNVDTLYSSAWLELEGGPMLLHVPNMKGRYYMLSMLDAWSNVFASIGSRTTGGGEQYFVIAGPGGKDRLPPNIPVIQAPTGTVWIIGRIQTNGPQDAPEVHALQQQLDIVRLQHSAISHPATEGHMIISRHPPKELVASMDAASFFNLMMSVMDRNPPYPAIQTAQMTSKLAALGLVPSPDFHMSRLDPARQQALRRAAEKAPEALEEAARKWVKQSQTGGWSMPLSAIGTYGTDYLARAVAADQIFGANVPQDAVYAFSFIDGSGNPLNGNNQYTMRFESAELPPVSAFWSLTLYNEQGFLVKNGIGRYALSPHLGSLRYNTDGALELYIQHAEPEADMKSNWLPAPKGPFNLLLRLYWPQASVLSGQWHAPPVSRSF